jgi:integrase
MAVQPIRDKKKIQSMKKILRGQNLRDELLFTLGINIHLRISDLLDFRIGDVIDDRGRVIDSYIERKEKKTGKTKTLKLNPKLRRLIEEYIKEERPGAAEDEFLFRSRKRNGQGDYALTRIQAYRIIQKAARDVGIQDRIGTHTMRKTFGYHAIRDGIATAQILQQLYNHSSERETLIYIGITQDEMDEVMLSVDL